jgi:hypothetical protein
MTYTDAAGNTFTKTFVLKRGDYAVNVNYNVQNAGENGNLRRASPLWLLEDECELTGS